MRYAIWCAVSTKQQATQDKISLEEQETKCREYAAIMGWKETAGPFIADGYSRTGYSDLSEALIAIPPLREIFDHIGKFDLLLMYSYDRMGDVLPMLSVQFKKFRKQVLSVSQPTPIQSPEKFDPYANEGAEVMQAAAKITQVFRINDLRRKWNAGIPKRIDRGLHPLSVPYGYAKAGPGEPAQIVPEQAELVKQMKNWFLSGATYAEICRRADEILPPARVGQWSINQVRRVLTNPYYAGIVSFGRLRTISGKRIRQPRQEWKVGEGRHTPLWDESTYRAIVEEFNRRTETHRHHNIKYPFTGLTYCGVCGGKVSKHGSRYKYLSCTVSHRHWNMQYDKAEARLTRALVKQMREYQINPPPPADTAHLEQQLQDHKELRTRIQEGYEAGLYNMPEAMSKLSAIDEAMQKLQQQLAEIQERLSKRGAWVEKMGGLQGMIDELPWAIENGEPAAINQLLSALIEKMILHPDRRIQIIWRA